MPPILLRVKKSVHFTFLVLNSIITSPAMLFIVDTKFITQISHLDHIRKLPTRIKRNHPHPHDNIFDKGQHTWLEIGFRDVYVNSSKVEEGPLVPL